MNGAEHYREAEKLLHKSQTVSTEDGYAQLIVAEAQVHATLALAAAQAQRVIDYGFDHPDIAAAGNWHAAIEPTAVQA